MVRFVDVAHMRDWVSSTGVPDIVRGMASYLEHDFRRQVPSVYHSYKQ